MRTIAMLACASLAACSGERQASNEVDLNAAAQQAQGDIDNYAANRRMRARRQAAARPAPVVVAAASSAAAVVTGYYALIGARRFVAAWNLWGHHGADCGRTGPEFTANQVELAAAQANVGAEQDADAGAGQRYVKVLVDLHLERRQGAPIEGSVMVTLHRVADGIETSDPTDHEWRIAAMSVTPKAGADQAAVALLMPCRAAAG